MNDPSPFLPAEYAPLLEDLKNRIRSAQLKAAVSVNRELVTLYWHIGRQILAAQQNQGWGNNVIDRLAADLRQEFAAMGGFSPRNLWRMRAMAQAYADEFLPQAVAEIPWGHNVLLLEKVKNPDTRLWYAQKAVEHGWSRNVLALHIANRLYVREGKAITNFERTLPAPLSDLAKQITKDPYNFEFLTLQKDAEERQIEDALIAHIRKFLLELGAGFAFVGSQYHLEVAGEDFYLDLLFYHPKLRCFVVIELKTGKFKPEYAGKLNFYLAVVDDTLRHKDDAPTIGLILCKDKKTVVAEYALRGMSAPMGVSEFAFTEVLPKDLISSLPTVEQIERELQEVPDQE